MLEIPSKGCTCSLSVLRAGIEQPRSSAEIDCAIVCNSATGSFVTLVLKERRRLGSEGGHYKQSMNSFPQRQVWLVFSYIQERRGLAQWIVVNEYDLHSLSKTKLFT